MTLNWSVSRSTWIGVLVIALIGGFFTWFFKSFDKVPYEKNTGYSAEARRNPFLAAELYLDATNTDFESRKDFSIFSSDELGEKDTVLINSSRIGMSKAMVESMGQWVERGGHLLLLATEPFDYEFMSSRDKYLDELGLRFYQTEEYVAFYDDDEDHLMRVNFDSIEGITEVHFYSTGYLQDASGNATFIGGTKGTDQFVQYQVGEGLVSVIIDFSIWQNNRIEEHDHAMFLTQLIGKSPKAWLVFNRIQPSIIDQMLWYIPSVLISSVTIFLLFILGALWRKGPPIANENLAQRQIMQHITAAGELSYRADNGKALMTALIQSIHQKMAKHVIAYESLSDEKKIVKISQVAQIDKSQIAKLWELENENYESFVAKTKIIQVIRKRL